MLRNQYFTKLISFFFISLLVLFSFFSYAKMSINVAVSANSPPMLFKDENGNYQGVDKDIFDAYCKSRNCTVSYKEYSWDGMLGAVATGQADVAFSGVSITEQRAKVMNFSIPYYDNTWHLASLTDKGSADLKIQNLSELKEHTIGYPRGMAYTDLIKNEFEPKGYYKTSDAKLYPSYNEVVADLQNKRISLAFIEEPVFYEYKKRGFELVSSYAFSGKDTLGFAFKKSKSKNSKEAKLLEDFNDFLEKDLTAKGVEKIVTKWLN